MGNGTFELSYGTAESSTMEKRLRTWWTKKEKNYSKVLKTIFKIDASY
ncbi:MAG: hypothetical protein ACJ72S_02540 [Nitrososphaeraceae archaeon]